MTSTTTTATTAAPASTSIVSEVEKGAVDAIAGLTNFFSNIGAQVKSAATVVASGVTTTATGAPIPATDTLGQAEAAFAALEKIVTDAKGGKWTSEPTDVLDFLTTGMAILAKFGVSIPGLSAIVSVLPTIAAIV